jgi:DNA primase
MPRETLKPPALWQQKATDFFEQAQRALWTEQASKARVFLQGRGLSDDSMRKLGWNPEEKYRDRVAWGLPRMFHHDGREKHLWFPAGLVIPCWTDGAATRLRIRRSDPDSGPRYVVVSGSSMTPMTWGLGSGVITVVESELDGLLIWQEAKN